MFETLFKFAIVIFGGIITIFGVATHFNKNRIKAPCTERFCNIERGMDRIKERESDIRVQLGELDVKVRTFLEYIRMDVEGRKEEIKILKNDIQDMKIQLEIAIERFPKRKGDRKK